MVVTVMGKLLAPVGRMIEVADGFEEVSKELQLGGQQNQQQMLKASDISHSTKFGTNTFLAEPISIMDEYETMKLYKLL